MSDNKYIDETIIKNDTIKKTFDKKYHSKIFVNNFISSLLAWLGGKIFLSIFLG